MSNERKLRITFTLRGEDLEIIEKVARHYGMTVGKWMREAGIEETLKTHGRLQQMRAFGQPKEAGV